jgi:ribosomal protein S18 acetylase RimI-like enzyme
MEELLRLVRSVRAAAARGRTAIPVDGFTLFVADSAHPHMNFAVPNDEAPTDWSAALAALRTVCATHGRFARIEGFAELHPDLPLAADAAGWRRAMTAPVLTLAPAALTPAPPRVGTYRSLDPDDRTRLEAVLRGAHHAFGGAEDDPAALAWLPQLRRGLRVGTALGGAVEVDGAAVSGAVVVHGDDAGELAGVWTHPSFRRRGLAQQACHTLLATAFAAGLPLAWLSAAEGALRLYETLGFERVGTQVNLDGP